MANTKRIRDMKRLMLVNAPPKPRLRKRKRPHRCKAPVLAAIPGTKGIWTALARRLGCTVNAIQSSMNQDGWEFVREAWDQEKLSAVEGCIENIYHLANYSVDASIRYRASKTILEKLHPDFKPEKQTMDVNGKVTHQHQHVMIHLPANVMDLPVEERLKVLERLDTREREITVASHAR